MTYLDLSNNSELSQLDCSNNSLSSLSITNNPALCRLYCPGNPIGKLDIRQNTKLLQAISLGEKKAEWGYASDDSSYTYIRYDLNAVNYYLAIPITSRLQTGPVEPPTITAHPQSVKAGVGKTVEFSVTAQGNGLKYQWYGYEGDYSNYKYTAIKGATGPKLNIKVKDCYNASYYCEVTNEGGVTCSKAVGISIVYKPYIYSQPTNKTVKAGKTVALKVKAGGESLKYQWYYQKPGTKKWVKINKATKATYKFTAKKKLNGYKYRCKVYNVAGSVNSKAVKLKVK